MNDRQQKLYERCYDLTDLAVQVIDHRIAENNAAEPSGSVTMTAFAKRYNANYAQEASVPEYIAFDTRGDKGIPLLVNYFSEFDPVNAVGQFKVWSGYKEPTDSEMIHVYSYMRAPEFGEELLRTTKFDSVVHAVYSYLFHWTDGGLVDYGDRYPEFKYLTESVRSEKKRSPVLVTKDKVPFVRSTFKLLSNYFNYLAVRQGIRRNGRPTFRIGKYVSSVLVDHFKEVYEWLLYENITKRDVRLLEEPMESPFSSTAVQYGGAGYRLNSSIKVITGQACCGKTTLLNVLKSYGWTVCSRGDLGTFSGKAKSAPMIASLHAALENALRRGDVLGDRGPIDNPLWAIIMPMCDPRYKEDLVQHLMAFFNSTINEHVVAYMCAQRVVVFVDPYPELNRARMMRRNVGGDAFRCRIHMYPIAQFMAYYMAARLYGWTVRCVPYDEERNFQPHRYANMAKEISKLFGTPIKQGPLKPATTPHGEHLDDKVYSIATNIFK